MMKPATGFAGFLARVFTNEKRNSFTVRLGSKIILTKFGITGLFSSLADSLLRGVLGLLIEDGTFVVDVALDAYREGEKLEEFKVEAAALYKKATAGILDEAKKNQIRQEYLDALKKIAVVGKPKS